MKRFIVSVIIFWLSIISFWYCDTVNSSRLTIRSAQSDSALCNWFCCFSSDYSYTYLRHAKISYWNFSNIDLFQWVNTSYPLTCLSIDWSFTIYNGAWSTLDFMYWDMTNYVPSTSCPTCPTCQTCNTWTINFYYNDNVVNPFYWDSTVNWSFNYKIYLDEYVNYSRNWSNIYLTWSEPNECEECQTPSCPSTGEILSWYVLESSIDSSYCIWNWLCPVVDPWSWNWSALFINWIQHESYPMINIDITDNVPWDYSINNDVFDLDIWEEYDQDFIDWVIDSQKTLPSKNDFNSTVTGLIPLFVPWLVIILFLYFTFRFIKKIF